MGNWRKRITMKVATNAKSLKSPIYNNYKMPETTAPAPNDPWIWGIGSGLFAAYLLYQHSGAATVQAETKEAPKEEPIDTKAK